MQLVENMLQENILICLMSLVCIFSFSVHLSKHPLVVQKGLFGGSNSKTWSDCHNISLASCQGKFRYSSFIFFYIIVYY